MAYPTSLDSFTTRVDGQPAYAAYFNDLQTAVVAVETALGTTPQGTYADVAAAITALAATKPIHTFLTMGA